MPESLFKENIKRTNLECRTLQPKDAASLGAFFSELVANGDDSLFHPHGFGQVDADRICSNNGIDAYYAVFNSGEILGYGLLRGWDEGYDIPSVGIAIGKKARGLGLGKMMMGFLHNAAKKAGATQVRLKVYKNNTAAIRLYEALGYRLEDHDDSQYLGIIEL